MQQHQGTPHTGIHASKWVSAEAAVGSVASGDWVDFGAFCGVPSFLDAALARRVDLEDVKVRALGYAGSAKIAAHDGVLYHSWHFSKGDRQHHDQGRCSFIPMVYHEAPTHYRRNLDVDVAMLRVAPMDEHGYFNYGVANSHQRAVIERAKRVVVEVNRSMPICLGGRDEAVHVDEVDMVVESDHAPLPELIAPPITDVERAIAQHIVERIPDGACIQLGIGALPNAVGELLADSDLKDLGIHTEMLADGYLKMIEAGRVTNRKKAVEPGKSVYTFALGTRRLYDFLDGNPACASLPVDQTNRLDVISANDRVVSINNALEIDLYGQVASESFGPRQISGTGGQLDFVYGAFHSAGGQSFIALSSTVTDKQGNRRSRIRPSLAPSSVVTVPRSLTHQVVTEFGVADLKGKSTWERAEALIGIAHPDFYDDLVREADALRIWRRGR